MDVLIDGAFELGEGARCIRGTLHFVDLLRGRLYAWDGYDLAVVVKSASPIGVAAPIANRPSMLLLAEGMSASVIELPQIGEERAKTIQLALPTGDNAMRVNDGCCDPFGRFWVGTMPIKERGAAGGLYRIDSVGESKLILGDIACPNGPAFGADGDVYFADTLGQTILRATLDPTTGEPGPFNTFARVENGLPDGMVVDDEGCLWVAIWGAGEVRRYDQQGNVRLILPTRASQPTSICLMSIEGRSVAVVTTARAGLTEPSDVDGSVLILEVEATAPQAAPWDPGDSLSKDSERGPQ